MVCSCCPAHFATFVINLKTFAVLRPNRAGAPQLSTSSHGLTGKLRDLMVLLEKCTNPVKQTQSNFVFTQRKKAELMLAAEKSEPRKSLFIFTRNKSVPDGQIGVLLSMGLAPATL